jgi:cytochrome c2
MISWKKHYKRSLIALSVLFSAGAFMNAQTGDAKAGEKLFKANCSSCHALDKKLVGPALGGVVERLKKDQNLDTTWIKSWVKNNEKLRASGDKYANEVYNANGKTAMTVFEGKLQDGDIDNILAYTSNPPKEEPKVDAAADAASNGAAPAQSGDNKMVVIGLLAIAGLLVWILLKLKQLVKLQASEELSELNATRVQTFGEIYEKYNKIFKALQALLALFAGYAVWNALMSIGVYQGYKPEQPIYFSHKIHAGENKIDCQLCHSSAKYGKVSEIPSVNVCMNCHRNIPEYKGKYIEPGKSREFYTGEIKKIYEAAGWDENKQVYTGKTKAIEWTRIHNMQDFVYFNHAQHVVAGEATIKKAKGVDVVCKACHGKIDTMNVVQMANPFTMGWCIECHRTTEVDMSNGYNKEYFQTLHNKVKKQYGPGTKMTVDAIGGIECGKCHY